MAELYLHEEVLLLALRDEQGTIATGSHYAHAIAGALVAELIVRQRIALSGTKKKRFLDVVDSTPVGERLLDEALGRIVAAKRRGTLTSWVSRLAGAKNLRDRLAEGLRRRGILRAETKEILLFFKRRTWPTVNPEPERELVEQLRRAIFGDGDVESRTIVLLSLSHRTGLLDNVFDRKERKARRDRIEGLIEQEAIGGAAASVIEAMQSAMTVVTITTAT
jgi:hypothetical protein